MKKFIGKTHPAAMRGAQHQALAERTSLLKSGPTVFPRLSSAGLRGAREVAHRQLTIVTVTHKES